MKRLKLTKNELKKQKNNLKHYNRFLPSLNVKKKQLQRQITHSRMELSKREKTLDKIIGGMAPWAGLLAGSPDFGDLIHVERIETAEDNIAGVDVPVYIKTLTAIKKYDLFLSPLWFDWAIERIGRLLEIRSEMAVIEEGITRLMEELRITSQRVNLFEKVKIPESTEAIRRITIYLGDQQTAAVGWARIAKRKIQEAGCMIIPMKRVTLVIKSSWREETLDRLRELGVVHLQHVRRPEGALITEIRNQIKILEGALQLAAFPRSAQKENDVFVREIADTDAMEIAGMIISSSEDIRHLKEEIDVLEKDRAETSLWGSFNPDEIGTLRESGIFISLFRCHKRELKTIREDVEVALIHREGALCYFAVVSNDHVPDIEALKVTIPGRSLKEIEAELEEKKNQEVDLRKQISRLSLKTPLLEERLLELSASLKYNEVVAGMGEAGDLAYLVGFAPLREVAKLRIMASEMGIAMLLEEPREDDPTPTLLEQSKWSRLFQPLMDFIGVMPGYLEYDVNGIFLMFFAVFFAMIVSDAGYGILLLAATFIGSRINSSFSKNWKPLFYILSAATIIWGMITGSWFGVESAAGLPILKELVVPGFYSFSPESESTVMRLCFIIAFLHLSAAHILKATRLYPSIKFIAEIGWISVILSIYFISDALIFKTDIHNAAIYFLTSGFIIILLFSGQEEDGIISGIFRGVKNLPILTLEGIGSFSNLISYIRLFAVGLATKEVAVAFNGMAESIGFSGTFPIIGAFLILLFGHTINILLAVMAVLVHGVRLNLLEFSGQAGIQWTGIPYDPFINEKERTSSGNKKQ